MPRMKLRVKIQDNHLPGDSRVFLNQLKPKSPITHVSAVEELDIRGRTADFETRFIIHVVLKAILLKSVRKLDSMRCIQRILLSFKKTYILFLR